MGYIKICAASITRLAGVNFLESRSLFWNMFFKIQLPIIFSPLKTPTVTGPAKGPLPASSMPIINFMSIFYNKKEIPGSPLYLTEFRILFGGSNSHTRCEAGISARPFASLARDGGEAIADEGGRDIKTHKERLGHGGHGRWGVHISVRTSFRLKRYHLLK